LAKSHADHPQPDGNLENRLPRKLKPPNWRNKPLRKKSLLPWRNTAAAVEEAVAAVEPVEVEAGIVETVPGEAVAEEVVPEEEPSLEEIFTPPSGSPHCHGIRGRRGRRRRGQTRRIAETQGQEGSPLCQRGNDPDKDDTIVRKQHKRGDDEWSF
jgi:hypothetical protein